MIRVVLAEKPDQAREYAKALGESEFKGGRLIVKQSAYIDGEIWIVSARGHLLEYDIPKQKWSFENLPNINVNFDLKLTDDADIKKRFKAISYAISKADEVIIGTDSDREGERIAYTILSQIPNGLKKATKRLWIHSMKASAIQEAFQNLKPAEETKNFYEEAEARSQADWLVGFNCSPLVTLDLQRKNLLPKPKKGEKTAFSVGRVQTPTVRLIYENDEAIKTFIPKDFWKISLLDEKHNLTFLSDEEFEKENSAKEVLQKLDTQAVINSIESKIEEKSAPKLFSLSTLQAYCAKQWKFSSDETLSIIQSLYQKKYLTYPRTAIPYITELEFEDLKRDLSQYQQLLEISFPLTNATPDKRWVNASKVKEHFAIIPTGEIPNLSELTEKEQKVYQIVALRSILMFAPKYKYESTTVTITNQEREFTVKGKKVLELGWKAFVSGDSNDVLLPAFNQGETINVVPKLNKGQTTPPKRLTEANLLGVMTENSLGTPATRASIIKVIQDQKYVVKDKSGAFIPTDRGRLLIEYLQNNPFSKVENTKEWEKNLKRVGMGAITKESFVDMIKQEIIQQVNAVKSTL